MTALRNSTTQENGPASPASDPDHGSNPAKDIKNMKEDSTAAVQRQEKDRRVVARVYEIEGDMSDLVNMTRIMVELLDSELQEHSRDESCVTIKIGRQHWDMVNFAVNDCVVRANVFREKFLAALEGRTA